MRFTTAIRQQQTLPSSVFEYDVLDENEFQILYKNLTNNPAIRDSDIINKLSLKFKVTFPCKRLLGIRFC